jgi:uncharacterized membrane protein
MNTLTVWRFPAPDAAETALASLQRLATGGQVSIDDAALISWPEGRRTPVTRELGSLTGPGGLWGGFWGMLLGLIFLAPLAGPTFGAAAGAVAGTLGDFGIADDFVKRVRESVTPGTSAIFILSSRATAKQVAAGLGGLGVEVLRSELSLEQEQHLRDALGDR